MRLRVCVCVKRETSLLFRQPVSEPNQSISHDNYSLFSSAPAADANRLPRPDLPLAELSIPNPPPLPAASYHNHEEVPHIRPLKGATEVLSEKVLVIMRRRQGGVSSRFLVLFLPGEEVPPTPPYPPPTHTFL